MEIPRNCIWCKHLLFDPGANPGGHIAGRLMLLTDPVFPAGGAGAGVFPDPQADFQRPSKAGTAGLWRRRSCAGAGNH